MRTTRKWIIAEAARLDVQVDVFSPGDGAARYQFHCPAGKSPMCRGATEAWTWLDGFKLALTEAHNRQTPAKLAEAVKNALGVEATHDDMLDEVVRQISMNDFDELKERMLS